MDNIHYYLSEPMTIPCRVSQLRTTVEPEFSFYVHPMGGAASIFGPTPNNLIQPYSFPSLAITCSALQIETCHPWSVIGLYIMFCQYSPISSSSIFPFQGQLLQCPSYHTMLVFQKLNQSEGLLPFGSSPRVLL